MVPGCAAHLRSIRNRVRWTELYDVFASRILTDQQAFAQGQSISTLGLTPTNAFLSIPSARPLPTINYESSILAGVPLAVKDNFCTDASKVALPTTCGSRSLLNYHAPYDASVVQSLLQAGCMLMGKTNMDEYAMGCGSTDCPISQPVINPWSCRQTCQDQSPVVAGGSSGGSAAAVAAGLCLVALASDTGGSARLPAAYCGVVGLKPTYGLSSRHGLIPLANSLDVPSIIAPYVADVAAVLSSWLRPDNKSARARDATCVSLSDSFLASMFVTLDRLAKGSTDWSDLHGIRIGIPIEYHAPGMAQEVLTAWDTTAGLLADSELKCSIKPLRLPHTPMATAVYFVLCASEVASNMARYDGLKFGYRAAGEAGLDTTEALFSATRSQGFGEVVRSRILAGNFFLLRSQRDRHLDAARRLWKFVIEDFRGAFNEVDFLLTPVTMGPAPKLKDFVQLDNRTRTTLDDVCTVAVNLAGLPAISIPVGLSSSTGLPLGLQLIGPAFSEPRLLQLASFIESHVHFPHLVDSKRILDSL